MGHRSAVFPGDLVQSKPGSVVKIIASGSSVSVGSDALVKFGQQQSFGRSRCDRSYYFKEPGNEGREVSLTPTTGARTAYGLKNTSGNEIIIAHQGDLTIKDSAGRRLYRKLTRPLAMLPINRKVAEQYRPSAAEYFLRS